MNLLASLINAKPFPLPEQHVRKIRDPDMPRTEDKPEKETKPPKRGPAYGTVQPAILAYLKTVRSAQPDQIAVAIEIHPDSVRRALRALVKEEKIVCVREAQSGKYRRPALWRVADNV
jgi:hypothetical protein